MTLEHWIIVYLYIIGAGMFAVMFEGPIHISLAAFIVGALWPIAGPVMFIAWVIGAIFDEAL